MKYDQTAFNVGTRGQFVFIFIIVLNFIGFFSKNSYISFKKELRNESCEPILTNFNQFSAIINGISYPRFVSLAHNESINHKCLNASAKIKTILFWNKHIGAPMMPHSEGVRNPFKEMGCPVTSCELTSDRSRFNDSSLVLFHLRSHIDYMPIKLNSTGQRFVHVVYESPVHCHLCTKYPDQFDLTASYRKDSDFTSVYWTDAGLRWRPNPNFEMIDFHASKSKFSTALISHCVPSRLESIRELQRFISLDLYGNCGLKCPNYFTCRDDLARKYKFFFLFENTVCTDYVTEKLFNTLRFSTVPVVLGGADYSHYMPRSGYVDALDFKSPMELANYLTYLDGNATAYNQYFEWKRFITVEKRNENGYLCEMCIQLQLEEKLGIRKSNHYDQSELDRLYGLKENCRNLALKPLEVKIFDFNSTDQLKHSGYMHKNIYNKKYAKKD